VASGDDSPCYDMTRAKLRDYAAAGEPVTVVISTDSSTPASLAAFVATVRIVQQFRPVNVWWQGAWLADDGQRAGYIFHAPLITNDMDFSRVQYVLENATRDSLSFSVLHQKAVVGDKVRARGMGRQADRAYMTGAEFVDHGGIEPTPEQVAARAADWLGIESRWNIEYRTEKEAKNALQSIPKERKPYVDTRTAEERAKDEKRMNREHKEWSKNRERQDRAAAAARARAAAGG
jgi:hypothetical protein